MKLDELKKRFETIHEEFSEAPYTWMNRSDAYHNLCQDLIKLCETYREVACSWVISETETLNKTKQMCIDQVDEEAEKLLTGK